MSKQLIKQAAIALIVGLGLVASGFAQDEPDERQRGPRGMSEAAAESFGLSAEQIDKIQEIRRARPPRGQSEKERAAWRAEQGAKVEAVLNDEQRAKVAQLGAMREQMRDFALAARMGLIAAPGRGRGAARQRGPRGGQRMRAGRGWAGPARGQQARHRGPDRRPGAKRGGGKAPAGGGRSFRR